MVTVWITVLSPIVMISTHVPVPGPPTSCAGTVELSIWHALPEPSEYEIGIGGTGLAARGRVSPPGRVFANAPPPREPKLNTSNATRRRAYFSPTPGAPGCVTPTY